MALPRAQAFDFLLFCQRNPRPCPILEVLEPGAVTPSIAPSSNVLTDISRYRIYYEGVLKRETERITDVWRNDLVTFLLGCSFTFESALMAAGFSLRHVEEGKNVSMYVTNISTVPAGIFSGPLVVSMRPIPLTKVVQAVQVTSRFPGAHGAPIHIGDPSVIGIGDLQTPDYGEPIAVLQDEVPVFWACGVTPQAVAAASKPPLMITHAPGHMFITDLRDEEFAVA